MPSSGLPDCAGEAGQQVDGIPDRLAEGDHRGPGDGHADEGDERHRREEAERLPHHLIALAAREAREVGNVEGEGGPVADHRGDPRHERGERRTRSAGGLEPIGPGQHRADAASGRRAPGQQGQQQPDEHRRRDRLEPLDALGAGPHEVEVDHPEGREAQELGGAVIHEPPFAAQPAKARPDAAEQGEDGQPAHPGLDAEPPARDHRAQHRRDVRAAQTEGGAGEDRERDAVARAGVRVDDHRHEHDRVADDDRQQARPPAQAGADHRRGEHVARDAHAHPDPERRDVPEVPGALGRRRGRQVGVGQGRRHRVTGLGVARSTARVSTRRTITPARCRR